MSHFLEASTLAMRWLTENLKSSHCREGAKKVQKSRKQIKDNGDNCINSNYHKIINHTFVVPVKTLRILLAILGYFRFMFMFWVCVCFQVDITLRQSIEERPKPISTSFVLRDRDTPPSLIVIEGSFVQSVSACAKTCIWQLQPLGF